MAVKSIIDISVNDEQFSKFQKLFQEYQSELAKSPKAWGKVATEIDGAKVSFEELAQAMTKTIANAPKYVDAQKRAAAETKVQAKSWHDMARDTKSFAAHIKDATTSLLRWGAITGAISGLLGVGGLFGIDRLAISAGNQRRSALGLGVSPGEQRSFGVNYGRLVDPNSFLSGVNQSMTDVTKRVGLYGAGLTEQDIRGKDTAQVGNELIPALKKLADQTPTSMLAQVLQARHLDQFISLQDFERLKNTSPAEIADYQRHYQADRKALDLSRAQQKAWQDLQVQLHLAGLSIEGTLIRGLTALAKPLGHLSNATVGLVETFLKSKTVGHWIDEVAASLESFAKFVGTPEFKTDVEGFVSGVGKMVTAIAGFLGLIGGKSGGGSKPGDPDFAGSPQHPIAAPKGWNPTTSGWGFDWGKGRWEYWQGSEDAPKGNDTAPKGDTGAMDQLRKRGIIHSAFRPGATGHTQEAHDFFRKAGWSEAQTAGLLANLGAESGLNPGAFNPAGGGQGAQGIAQWRGSRIADFRRLFGHDPSQGTFEEQLAFVQWELTHSEKAAGDKLRTLGRTPGGSAAIVNRDYERGGASSAARSATAGQYAAQFKDRSVQVTVTNNTGGNAHVSVAQLAV